MAKNLVCVVCVALMFMTPFLVTQNELKKSDFFCCCCCKHIKTVKLRFKGLKGSEVLAGSAAAIFQDFVVVFVPVWSESRDPTEVHT